MISVVIPAFNAGATIGEQLDALAAQARGVDLEVVVADNGSADDTLAVVASRQSALPVRVIDASQRRGPGTARNIGAAEARGELLVFTDADDVVLPGWLSEWQRLDPAIQFATGPLVRFAVAEGVPTGSEFGGRLPVHLGFRPYASGNNFAVRRDLFEQLRGFDEELTTAEDVELSWRLQIAGVALTFVPRAAVAVRMRPSTSAVFRQYYRYGKSDPVLCREFRAAGLSRPAGWPTVKSYLGLVARLPLLFDETQRRRWCSQAGRRVGRLIGSIEARSFCP